MIDINCWPLKLQIAFLLAPFIVGLSGGIALAYTTARHYEQIMAAFPSSPGVQNFQRGFAGYSFRSRCMQVAVTAGFVFWPKKFIRRSELCPDEVHNFPREIKRLMIISIAQLWIAMAWLALLAGLLKLSDD